MPNKPLMVLITGDPVPEAEQRRGDFGQLIQQSAQGAWPGEWKFVDVRTSGQLPEPESVAGVLLSGSPARLVEQTDWMRRSVSYARRLVETQTPTLGICFGHQILGEALGGRVAPNPNGREIGTVELTRHTASELFADDVEPLTANATHLDSIVELPTGAEVIASSELEPHAAVRFSTRAFGVQFHPEIDGEVIRYYISARTEAISSEGLDPVQLHDDAHDAHPGRDVVRRFIERIVLSG